jgi:hypothetical protein
MMKMDFVNDMTMQLGILVLTRKMMMMMMMMLMMLMMMMLMKYPRGASTWQQPPYTPPYAPECRHYRSSKL